MNDRYDICEDCGYFLIVYPAFDPKKQEVVFVCIDCLKKIEN